MFVAPGQVWRHYKGDLYEIIDVGYYEPTGEMVVLYRPKDGGAPWVRPLGNFLGKSETHSDRFVRVK